MTNSVIIVRLLQNQTGVDHASIFVYNKFETILNWWIGLNFGPENASI
jgi:hypothetical protein